MLRSYGRIRENFVFPEADYMPAQCDQAHINLSVTLSVSCNLARPERCVRLGSGSMHRASVPKATVDEHCHPSGREDEIRTSWKRTRSWQSKPQAASMKRTPQRQLWPCATLSNGGHDPAALRACSDVHLRIMSQDVDGRSICQTAGCLLLGLKH